MRFTALSSRPKKIVARGSSFPAPTGGWDAISPLANMPPENAIRLENWFPQAGYCEIRNGHAEHSDTGTGEPVETIMAYQGVQNALFAVSNEEIFDITIPGSAVSVYSGLTNSRLQYTNFATSGGNFIWACNGDDNPIYYDGSAFSSAVISGTGITPSDMIQVVPYKGRLWTVLKNKTAAAYLPLDSIQGSAELFEVGTEFNLGGTLNSIGVWSTDSNNGPTSYLVFVSTKGEILVYNISDPTSPTGVELLGKGIVGSPVGRRSLTPVGSDLAIICLDGVLPISKVLTYDRGALIQVALTRNIQPVMNDSARAYFNNFGWELTSYPRGNMAILNVPLIEASSQQQYVMNTVTGAWCLFTGQNANCWEIYDNRPFFGGNDGVVYEADKGPNDAGNAIPAELKTAFSYYNARGRQKRWNMCRPIITTDGTVQPSLGLDVDFQDTAIATPENTILDPVALWDVALWDIDVWPVEGRTEANWQTVSGIGYCAALKMKVLVSSLQSAPIILQINGFDVILEDGAFI